MSIGWQVFDPRSSTNQSTSLKNGSLFLVMVSIHTSIRMYVCIVLTYKTKQTDQRVKTLFKLVLWLVLGRGSLYDSSLVINISSAIGLKGSFQSCLLWVEALKTLFHWLEKLTNRRRNNSRWSKNALGTMKEKRTPQWVGTRTFSEILSFRLWFLCFPILSWTSLVGQYTYYWALN